MFPFAYPPAASFRRHGPQGYANPEGYRPWLRDEFTFRCVYCLKRERWAPRRREFDVEHVIPRAANASARVDYDNLVYACASCNSAKRSLHVPDPFNTMTAEAVVVDVDGQIYGLTKDARTLIRLLGLNSRKDVEFRRLWIDSIALAEQFDRQLYEQLLSYPDDLPELTALRPPLGNTRPEGLQESYFARRLRNDLDPTY